MRTLLFEVVGTTLVSVAGREPITDAEWDALNARMQQHDFRAKYVWSAGGTTTSAQRMRTRQALRDESEPVALLTDQVTVRLSVGLLNLFFKKMAAFPMTAEEQAMDWLQIPQEERRLVRQAVQRMRKELGV